MPECDEFGHFPWLLENNEILNSKKSLDRIKKKGYSCKEVINLKGGRIMERMSVISGLVKYDYQSVCLREGITF